MPELPRLSAPLLRGRLSIFAAPDSLDQSMARWQSEIGSSPVLTALTFNNSGATYTVGSGSGGSITLGTAAHTAVVAPRLCLSSPSARSGATT